MQMTLIIASMTHRPLWRNMTHRVLCTHWPDTQRTLLTKLTWHTVHNSHTDLTQTGHYSQAKQTDTWHYSHNWPDTDTARQDTTHILAWHTQDTTHGPTWRTQNTTDTTDLTHWPDAVRTLLTQLTWCTQLIWHIQNTTNKLVWRKRNTTDTSDLTTHSILHTV
jgi:hypothetical protein